MDNSVTYYVDNYFQGFQLICLDDRLLTWWDRVTEKQHYELATLGMDGIE